MHNGQNTYLAEYGKIWFPLKKKKKRGRKKGDGGREGCGRGLYTLKNN